jgi:hypothetical protein
MKNRSLGRGGYPCLGLSLGPQQHGRPFRVRSATQSQPTSPTTNPEAAASCGAPKVQYICSISQGCITSQRAARATGTCP